MGKLPNTTLNLKQFLQRQEVIKLYRSLLRCIHKLPDENNRNDLKDWIKKDFKNNKHVNDEHVIKALMLHGEAMLKELQLTVQLTK